MLISTTTVRQKKVPMRAGAVSPYWRGSLIIQKLRGTPLVHGLEEARRFLPHSRCFIRKAGPNTGLRRQVPNHGSTDLVPPAW